MRIKIFLVFTGFLLFCHPSLFGYTGRDVYVVPIRGVIDLGLSSRMEELKIELMNLETLRRGYSYLRFLDLPERKSLSERFAEDWNFHLTII